MAVKEDSVIIADASNQTITNNDRSMKENHPYFDIRTTYVTGNNEIKTVIRTGGDMREVKPMSGDEGIS